MKKLLLMTAVLFAFFACTEEEVNPIENATPNEVNTSTFDHEVVIDRNCSAPEINARILEENPELLEKQGLIEAHTRSFIEAKKPTNPGGGNGGGNGGGGDDPGPTPFEGVVTIPVVVHVVYNTQSQNISDQQINSQIAVLNDDFRASNSDVNSVPSEFSGDVSDSEIEFVLDRVIRVASSVGSWGTNDAVKFSSNGGSDVVDPANYLNIWVANIGGGILGYAQFPGGPTNTDGVVVGPEYFGTTGTASSPFDEGRTTTHEVGHWLNLRHIWGDGRCNRDDFVSDTPRSDRPNYGCPGYPTSHCRSTDMTMNYMDYVNDACMYMFSNGQTDRMRALFASGGARESFVQ